MNRSPASRPSRSAVFAFSFICATLAAAETQYGHKDFHPTPERPVGWRGDGTGRYPGATPVTSWDETTGSNVLWKLPLPWGYGQPIVVGERVFTQADPDVLYAVEAKTGKVAWRSSELPAADDEAGKRRGWFGWYGWSFPTPVSDGRFVYTLAARKASCYALDGKLVWSNATHQVGRRDAGVELTLSPMLVADRLIYLGGVKQRTDTLFALDPVTGKERWRCGVTPDRGSEAAGSVMPVTVRLGHTDLVVTHMGDAVRVSDGRLVGTNLFARTPLREVGYNYITSVNPAGLALLRLALPGAAADRQVSVAAVQLRLAENERVVAQPVWGPLPVEARDGHGPTYAGQIHHTLFHDGHWYWQGWPDLITIAAANGRTVAWQKAPREMAGHGVWHEFPTPHLAGKYIFTGDRNGHVAVYEASPQWQRVALNQVAAPWHSNPFFHGDRVYIRTRNALYCLGPNP